MNRQENQNNNIQITHAAKIVALFFMIGIVLFWAGAVNAKSNPASADADIAIQSPPGAWIAYSEVFAQFHPKYINLLRCAQQTCTNPTMLNFTPFGTGYPVLAASGSLPYVFFENAHPQPQVAGFSFPGLYLKHCLDAGCLSSTQELIANQYAGEYGMPKAIAIAKNGFPVLAFVSVETREVHFIKCHNASCSQFSESSPMPGIHTTGSLNDMEMVILPQDDRPVIVSTNLDIPHNYGSLGMMVCHDAACTSATRRQIDSAATTFGVDLAIGQNGFPIVVYDDIFSGKIKSSACVDADCSSMVIRTFGLGSDPEMVIPAGGNPVIFYYNNTTTSPNFLRFSSKICSTPTCAGPVQTTHFSPILGGVFNVTFAGNAIINDSGNPQLFLNSTLDQQRYGIYSIECETSNCATYTVDPILPDFSENPIYLKGGK